ncbi:MAG: phage major tail tube protein [Synergistaceae bacterium]|nr:phage major tail tube protein [Synergistaceae bacterium]MBQ3653475.1 phage major tail tube protein [Synergistaceae bacterium]
MPNLIPEKLNNFAVYLEGAELLGIADGNFPSVEFMTTEIKGAGIAGTLDSPALGHTQSITVTLNWRTVTEQFTRIAAPRGHALELYGETLAFDAGSGTYKSQRVHVYMRALTKKFDMGKLAVVESMEAQTEHEVYYLKVMLDGAVKVELDKYNYVFVVDGEDYLSDTRRALGKM